MEDMMKKRLLLVSAALLVILCVSAGVLTSPAAAEKPVAARTWTYLNLTTLLSPNWAWVVMPGHRYEFYRDNDPSRDAPGVPDTKETYFWEFFTGPVYIKKFGDLTLKLPLWYYYMGFPVNSTDKYFYSHNIEFLPIVEYKIDRLKLYNRVIFHNKVYAHNTVYTKEQYSGYSLLIREKFQVSYALTKEFALILADELFFGAIEDKDTKDIAKGEPFFAQKKFNKNRLYAGGAYKFTPFLNLSLQYVYETNYNPDNDGALTERDHYIMTTLTYVLKLF